MTIQDALDILLQLARDNMIDDEDMTDERARQETALAVVEDFYVNHLGED